MASQILVMLNLSSQVTIINRNGIPWDTVTHVRSSRHVRPLTINLLFQYLNVMHVYQALCLSGVIHG